jgi:hypothetical protein
MNECKTSPAGKDVSMEAEDIVEICFQTTTNEATTKRED